MTHRLAGSIRRLPLLLLCAAAGCSKGPPQQADSPPVPVTVATAQVEDVPVEIRAIGNGEAYLTVTIKPRVSGQLANVHIHEGQAVPKNWPIFTIDPRPFQTAVDQAQATLDRDTALAAYTRHQAERQAELYQQKLISPADNDQAKAQADAAQATVEADKAAKKNAELQLAYCYIASPIEGVAGSLMVDGGNNVKVDDTAMLTINQVQPIYVTFSVPEQHLAQIQAHLAERLKALAYIPPDTEHPETGTLVFVDNQVDASTGMIRLKAEFPNQAQRLWPGQYVQVTLAISTEPHAIVVPSEAIQPSQQGSFVFVVKDDLTVEAQEVVPGRSLDGRTIVQRGLSAGQRVVTDGQVRLVTGAKVEIRASATQPTTGPTTRPAAPATMPVHLAARAATSQPATMQTAVP